MADDFTEFWKQSCSHGYSRRSACPRCRSDGTKAARRARGLDVGDGPKRSTGKSVYDDPAWQARVAAGK